MPSRSRSRVLAGTTIEPFRIFAARELTRKREMAFSFRAGTNWCHDFPKLARESGFHFNMHRRRVRVDWNRISSIDVDRVIGERDFSTIDDNVNNVVDYCLESEYDVKILDPNFVKLFRLAQLAVEYLLYCKQYLDHSVVILKEELKIRLEESVRLKNELGSSEKSVKELRDKLNRERSKSVEAKLSDSHGEIHKCPRCPKTFVSALFLTAHVNRRHPDASPASPDSPGHERYRAETEKLHSEIKSLKERLNLAERVIRNESDKFLSSDSVLSNDNRDARNNDRDHQSRQNNRERDDVFEEQHRRYQEEIGQLKATLFDEIRSLKSADRYAHEKSDNDDCNNVSIKELIREQENEITRLRQELAAKRTSEAAREAETRRDETREELWQSKMASLEARYHADMEALYDQLRVTQKSADQMRHDYTTRLSDLERREASLETSLTRGRGDEDRARYRATATGDNTSRVAISDSSIVEAKNLVDPTRSSRRFSGHEERARIAATNREASFSDSEPVPDRDEASEDGDEDSGDAIARRATATNFARTTSTKKREEKMSRVPEDREKRNNNGEAAREKTSREYSRNGEMKIRVLPNRRVEPREKSWNCHESREKSSNVQGPGDKSWNRHNNAREKSSNRRTEPREKSSNAHDPGEKSRHRWNESREMSSDVHEAREKSWHRRDEPRERCSNARELREKSSNVCDESREKFSSPYASREKSSNPPTPKKKSWSRTDESPNFREPRERSGPKTRSTSVEIERRRTRAGVSRRPDDLDRAEIGKSARRDAKSSVARGRETPIDKSANESAKYRKSGTFSSSEELSDSMPESESISESSRTADENERDDRACNRPDQRNDRSHIEEKAWQYEKAPTENGLELFNSKLRELGVDPEWRGIPDATFAQILEIVRHHRNINSKKYRTFEDVRRRLIHELSRRLVKREKKGRNDDTNERSQLGRLVTNVKSKVSKALTILEKNDGSYGTRPVSATMNKSVRRDNDESRKFLADRSPADKSRPKAIVAREPKKSANPQECPSSEDSCVTETNATANANERYVDLPRRNDLTKASSTNEHKQLTHSYESIKDFIRDANPRQARSIFNVSGGLVTSTPHKNSEIPIGDTSASERKETPRDPSTAVRTVKERNDDFIHEATSVDSPRNNDRGVLKSAIGGSSANLAKKKVLFDLESTQRNARNEEQSMYPDEPANDDARDTSESDFDISSIRDERDQPNEAKNDSPQAAKVVLLKTSQSEKIAQISQQIEKQLSMARRKPAGAVEAIFMEKFGLPSDNKDSPINVYPKFESSENSTNKTAAPSWRSDSRLTDAANKRDEIADLDMDIDELLRLE